MNIALSSTDIASITPLLFLLGGALALLLIESFAEKWAKQFSIWIALFTIAISLYAVFVAPVSTNPMLTNWLKFDSLSHFFTILFLCVGFASALLADSFFKRFEATQGEYYFLLLSCLFGLILIAASADFLTLFLGLETLSISLYIMCGYMKKWELSHEASLKYFLMGALAAAFLLYGIALVYGAIGTTRFGGMLASYKALQSATDHTLFFSGIALITLGFAFKAAIVPFHVWAPDVYDGAPNPVTAFMAVGTKAGAFAAFARVFLDTLPQFSVAWSEVVALLAYPTLIYANVVALRQVQLRRFFAYSGISHAGFLLIPIVAGGPEALASLEFYLVIYSLATLGCFAVLANLDVRSEGVMLTDLHGLFKRAPWLAGAFIVCLLTLGGIPPTAGFFAKFYIFKVAFHSGYYGLVVVGLLTTILSAYYYLRIAAVMMADVKTQEHTLVKTWPAAVVGLVAIVLIVGLSVYPAPLMSWIY